AGAIAAAIAASLIPDTCPLSVVDAAIYGARKGYEIGKEKALVLRAPSMVDRIQLAVEIAISPTDFETTCERLAQVVGCGLPIIEAVPFAIGLFVASRGDPKLAVIGAVNMGGDADTTATITGAVAGTYAGISRIDQELYSTIVRVNNLDLENMARQLTSIAMKHVRK
ncbi:MAG: ADP-ribosylglycohydrolase family protein, partial [Anaerolineales bacterium]